MEYLFVIGLWFDILYLIIYKSIYKNRELYLRYTYNQGGATKEKIEQLLEGVRDIKSTLT